MARPRVPAADAHRFRRAERPGDAGASRAAGGDPPPRDGWELPRLRGPGRAPVLPVRPGPVTVLADVPQGSACHDEFWASYMQNTLDSSDPSTFRVMRPPP